MTTAMVIGQYVDPSAGRITVREFAEEWRAAQVHRPTTAAHVHPVIGNKRLSSVLPSDIHALVKRLSLDLAQATVGVVHRILAGVFKAAVRDRRIVSSPCEGTKLPRIHRKRLEPLTVEAIPALTDAMPDRYRAVITLAAGAGLRRGEAFGLTVNRVDFLRRQLTVDRQLVTMPDRAPYLAPPKTQASVRVVPLPQVLIRHGESVKTVQARLGHASAAETLDIYSHLWPDSDDRTRAAVDSVLGGVADSLRTGEAR